MTIHPRQKTLFVSWQDDQTHSWFPIGKLTFDGDLYQFVYINGAKIAQKKCNFTPLFCFPNLDEVYTSRYLFPVFANRLMSRSRLEYKNFIKSLDLWENNDDLMLILGRSEGKKETDSLAVFPEPDLTDDGEYKLYFLAHGLRYLTDDAINKIATLNQGDFLSLTYETEHNFHSKILTLNTEDNYVVGYCPRYLFDNIFDIFVKSPSLIKITVVKVNLAPIPIKYRLLCQMTYSGCDGYKPFTQKEYQPIYEQIIMTV